MLYVKDGIQIDAAEVRRQYPNMSIPDGADLSDIGIHAVIEVDPPVDVPDAHHLVSGIKYDKGQWVRTWTPEPNPIAPTTVPAAVTMRQARLALLGAGVLDAADAAIAAMPGVEGKAARIEWEYAHEIRRDAPLVAGMSAMLGLNDTALDALFVAANGL